MKTISSARLKLPTPVSKLENWSPIWTFYIYIRSLPEESTIILFCNTVAEVADIFTVADTRIEGAQIGNHETKQ